MTNRTPPSGTGNKKSSVTDEINRIENMINSGPMQRQRQQARSELGYVRPKNASSIILIKGEPGEEKVVMGKRNKALKFMPGALVFPGGSVDRGDGRVNCVDQLHPKTRDKLLANMRGKSTDARAHSLGVAAIRELAEETGLLVGKHSDIKLKQDDWSVFAQKGMAPSVAPLRLLARAITPPGLNRRFDTWFFAMRLEDDHFQPDEGFQSSGELEDLQWIRPQDAMAHETREITRVILVELMQRLERDRALSPETPAPCYITVRDQFKRTLM